MNFVSIRATFVLIYLLTVFPGTKLNRKHMNYKHQAC